MKFHNNAHVLRYPELWLFSDHRLGALTIFRSSPRSSDHFWIINSELWAYENLQHIWQRSLVTINIYHTITQQFRRSEWINHNYDCMERIRMYTGKCGIWIFKNTVIYIKHVRGNSSSSSKLSTLRRELEIAWGKIIAYCTIRCSEHHRHLCEFWTFSSGMSPLIALFVNCVQSCITLTWYGRIYENLKIWGIMTEAWKYWISSDLAQRFSRSCLSRQLKVSSCIPWVRNIFELIVDPKLGTFSRCYFAPWALIKRTHSYLIKFVIGYVPSFQKCEYPHISAHCFQNVYWRIVHGYRIH